jgi:hypothetical protein
MRDISAKVRVARLAERQWGLVTAAQLVALGVARETISRWTQDGYLHQVHPRVYAVGHQAGGVERDHAAALLYAGPGAMLSHATAIWWLGLSDRQPRTMELSTPRRCRSVGAIKVHGRRTCERVWHKRLPTTNLEQSLLDYAAVAPDGRIRHALAEADYMKVLDLAALRATLGSGRAGSARLRHALARHEPKLAHTRSPLERLFLPLCESYGIPLPDINVYVEGILVDAVWRDQRLVVELDGRDNHSSWAQIQRDRSNELRLRAAGFRVIRYGWRQVEEEPEVVAADLLRALGLRPNAPWG